MGTIIKEAAALFGTYALFAIVAGWLLKVVLLESLKRGSDEFKDRLTREGDAVLERTKSDLERQRRESELRFGTAHQKQSLTLPQMYRRLAIANRKTAIFQLKLRLFAKNPEKAPPSMEEAADVITTCHEAVEAFDENRLFLPKELEKQIETIISRLSAPAARYAEAILTGRPLDQAVSEILQTERGSTTKREDLDDLAGKIRALLGVDT